VGEMTRRRAPALPPPTAPLPAAVRVGVHVAAAAAAIAGVLVAALPGSVPGGVALGLGMTAFLVLPLLVTPRRGVFVQGERGAETVLTGRSTFDRVDLFARVLGVAAWLAVISLDLAPHPSSEAFGGVYGFLIGTACVLLAAIGAWRNATTRGGDAPKVTLERETVTVRAAGGLTVLRYDDLTDVRVEGATVWLATAAKQISVPVDARRGREVAHAIAQRIERAKKVQEKSARGAESSEPAALKRPAGATTLAWLTQLDALAALLRAPDGYRRGGLDEDKLWRTLGDDGAHVEARVAAARVLAKGSDDAVRVRVDAAVKELPEPVRVRVASALSPEVEEAAAAFEATEMAELKRDMG
jgi:hypothetical protein